MLGVAENERCCTLIGMNPNKHPKPESIKRLPSRNSQHHHGAEGQPSIEPIQQGNDDRHDQLVNGASEKPIETIRYAHNARGMLSHRDPDVLRRYVLDARTEEEQAARQNELFKCASVALACVPSGHQFDLLQHSHAHEGIDHRVSAGIGESFKSLGVVNCGVFGCPIVVTFKNPKKIFRRLPLDHLQTQAHVARAIEKSLAMCSATPLAFARVESMICLNDLNGITPLQVQAATSNESRRMNGDFKDIAVQIPDSMSSKTFNGYRRHQGGWSLQLPQVDDVWTEVGPNQPVSFLIIGYLGWDCYLPSPLFVDHSKEGALKLRTLIEGYLAQDRCSGDGELGSYAAPDRVQVEVGKPTWIHEALTEAQAMQFAIMEKSAGKTQSSFALKREQYGSILHWTGTISPMQHELPFSRSHVNSAGTESASGGLSCEQPTAVVESIYDAFWRPESHALEIEQRVLVDQCGIQIEGNRKPALNDSADLPSEKLH
jgi:hypothetical protein